MRLRSWSGCLGGEGVFCVSSGVFVVGTLREIKRMQRMRHSIHLALCFYTPFWVSTSRWALGPQEVHRVMSNGSGFFVPGLGNGSACPVRRSGLGRSRFGRGSQVAARLVGALLAWRRRSGQPVAVSVGHTCGRFAHSPRPTRHSTGRRCSAVASSAAPRPGAGEFSR